MRLIKLTEYRRLVYVEGSAPSLGTLRARVHEIPGGQILHGHYFVDLDKLEAVTDMRAEVRAKERALAENPLLAGLV